MVNREYTLQVEGGATNSGVARFEGALVQSFGGESSAQKNLRFKINKLT